LIDTRILARLLGLALLGLPGLALLLLALLLFALLLLTLLLRRALVLIVVLLVHEFLSACARRRPEWPPLERKRFVAEGSCRP
jgi:hypothetical protein